MNLRRPLRGASFVAMALVAAGCRKPSPPPPKPPPSVHLPPSPAVIEPLPERDASRKAWTVFGALRHASELFGKPVRVVGRVVDRHLCAPDQVDCYPPPHAYLTDAARTSGRQLLVVAPRDFIDKLVPGTVTVVEGTFKPWTEDHVFVRSEGLVEVPPPPAPSPDAASHAPSGSKDAGSAAPTPASGGH